jgi:phage-related protein
MHGGVFYLRIGTPFEHETMKKTQKTSPQDKNLAKQRYKAVIQERSRP